MAAWQCALGVVPRPLIRDEDPDNAGADSPWAGADPPKALWLAADSSLGRAESWSDELWIWGQNDGTCLEAFWEGAGLEEVTLRIDLRQPRQTSLPLLLKAMRQAGLDLMDSDGRRIPANWEGVSRAIVKSDAWRFVQSPREFLDELTERRGSASTRNDG